MYENQINQLSQQVEKFLSRESNTSTKIQEIETKINKMNHYFLHENIQNNTNFEEKTALDNFIRKGITGGIITKGLSGSGDEGGVVLTPTLSQKIISSINVLSPMRQLASIETISTRALDVIIEDGNFAAGWVGESAERDTTDTPKLAKITIQAHEIFAQPKATTNLIDDSEINIESWLVERLTDSFVKLENEAFILGSGTHQPQGLLKNEHIERIKVGETLNQDTIMRLINKIKEGYLENASLLMNRNTLSIIQSLQDKTGRFIWQQSLENPLKQSIFGIPVVLSSHMPDIGDESLSIAIGDFKSGYKIVDRTGINLLRDPYTEKPFVRFYAVKRVGGAVVNSEAIKFAQFSAL